MNESKPKKSVSLNDISKYIPTHIKQNDNDFLLIYYLYHIRNYISLNDEMITNIYNFDNEKKNKIINELLIVNRQLLDMVLNSD